MPTYVYKFVDSGETIEVQQAFHDDTLTELAHPETGEVLAVKKVFTPVGVTFKGSGFFKTDNRGKKSATTSGSSTNGSGGDSSSSSGSSESSSSSDSSSTKTPAAASSGAATSTSSSSGASTST